LNASVSFLSKKAFFIMIEKGKIALKLLRPRLGSAGKRSRGRNIPAFLIGNEILCFIFSKDFLSVRRLGPHDLDGTEKARGK
jgi:hypothetical protein